jgi:hypothetical protein
MSLTSATFERVGVLGCRRFFGVLGVLTVLILSGCATPIPGAKTDLLDFLKEGQTRREEVILALGQPSGAFEREKILTYRVGRDAKQGYFIVSPKEAMPWQGARYSLVLLFDDNGLLRTHNLVAVQ